MDFLKFNVLSLEKFTFFRIKQISRVFDWEKLLKMILKHKKTRRIIFLIINCEIGLKLKNVVERRSKVIKYLSLQGMKTSNKKVQLKDLGLKDYKDIWEYQTSLLDTIIAVKRQNRKENTNNPTKNYFLLVEHPHVYTLGKSGDLSNLLINEQQLKDKGLPIIK